MLILVVAIEDTVT